MMLAALHRSLERKLEDDADVYDTARRQYSALAPYVSATDAVAALCFVAPSVGESVLTAILTEQRCRPHRLWAAALIVTFTPLLMRLAYAVAPTLSDEAEPAVLAAFFEVANTLPLTGRFTLSRLRRELDRRVFRMARAERRRGARELLLDHEMPDGIDAHRASAASSHMRADIH